MNFKILFPTGYQVNDFTNDNLDVHIVLDTGEVYFATLFTPQNIQSLMSNAAELYFWATDMVVLSSLEESVIKTAVEQLVADGYLGQACTRIGQIDDVYSIGMTFEKLTGIYCNNIQIRKSSKAPE